MKILITGGTTATALKLIKAFSTVEILLGDYGETPTFNSNTYKFVGLGELNKDILAHNMLTTCLDNNVDTVLPIYDFEIEALAKSITLFEEFGIKILIPQKNMQLAPENSSLSKDWAVFNAGAVVFSTSAEAFVANKGIEGSLNGAYFIDIDKESFSQIFIS